MTTTAPANRTRVRTRKKHPNDPALAPPPPFAPELLGKPDSGRGAIITDATQRETMIREAAYFRAQQRGFVPGQELEDWLTAELEIDAHLNSGGLSNAKDA